MNTIAIVGKPNVGKSTLFNRIIQTKKSIVNNQSGVTRDRIYAHAEWLTRKFEIIDTGGFSNKEASFQKNINFQVQLAIEEANVIIFLVSYKNGINNDDMYVAKMLKKYNKTKKIILVANMSETYQPHDSLDKFYPLGFGKPIMISAEHGIGTGDLLDDVVKNFHRDIQIDQATTTFCIIGKPNVGKSSLANAILQKERVIVSEIDGTTRDSIDVDFKYHQQIYTLIDTAGIRRKGKIVDEVEKYAVLRAEKAISRSQVILLVLDGSKPFSEQDEVIGGLCHQANIPTIIIVNKMDLIKHDDQSLNLIKKEIRERFKYLFWAPIIFISALENKKINHIFNTIDQIKEQLQKKVSTSILNDVVMQAQMLQQAPIFKGARTNISYVTQIESQIPSFVIFCSNVKCLHFSYARYIENKIREAFGFNIVPVTLYWKDKNARTRGVKEHE